MQKFLMRQSLCAAICITMAFTVCTCTAAVAGSETRISIAAELGTGVAESFDSQTQQQPNIARVVFCGFAAAMLPAYALLKAEVTKAIIPEP